MPRMIVAATNTTTSIRYTPRMVGLIFGSWLLSRDPSTGNIVTRPFSTSAPLAYFSSQSPRFPRNDPDQRSTGKCMQPKNVSTENENAEILGLVRQSHIGLYGGNGAQSRERHAAWGRRRQNGSQSWNCRQDCVRSASGLSPRHAAP